MKDSKIKFPISLKHILLFSALIILVLGVSTFLVSTLVRGDDRRKAEENNHTINARTAETVQLTFSSVQNNSYILFDAVSKLNGKTAQSAGSDSEQLVSDFFNVNRDVVFIFSPDTDLKINPSYSNENIEPDAVLNFIKAKNLEGAKVYNSNELLNPSVVLFFKYGPSNVVKTAAVGLDTNALASLMSTGSNNATLLVDENTNVLINPDFESKEKKYAEAFELIDYINNKTDTDNTQSLIETLNGKKFIAVHKIKNDLFVITTIPEKAVFAVINRTTYRIILFSLAVLFIAIIIIRLFSKNITNPIADLVEASAKIEQGEFELGIEPRTKDEIGLLTSSFIQMSRGLAEREKLLVSFS